MALPNVVTYQLAPLNASALATSQAATSLAINLNVTSTLSTGTFQRRVVVASAGDDKGVGFRIIGFNQANMTISEIMAAGNATVVATSVLDYVRLISVTPVNFTTGGIGTTAGSVTVGGSGTGSSLWYTVDWHSTPVNIACAGIVAGTVTAVNYSIQYTYDDPNNLPLGTTTPAPFTLAAINAATTSLDGAINDPVTAVRLLINSGSGTVKGTFIQAGLGGY